jgi:hypothetical protein
MEQLMQPQKIELEKIFKHADSNIFGAVEETYWSNLNQKENKELIDSLKNLSTKEAITKFYPYLYDVIFSPKRWGGLELLDIKGDEACIDCGCMWGALTMGLAKRCKYVLGVDQTMDSLRFLTKRIKEESLSNVDLLCTNLKKLNVFENKFDIAVVNGVLEWIPEENIIELKSYYGKRSQKKYSSDPYHTQLNFLKIVKNNLQANGKIYLAIENRFDVRSVIGGKDPHANIRFTSILPRNCANLLSRMLLGRPYVTWIYSFNGIKKILLEAGFHSIDLYMCFPNYRFPELILPYNSSLSTEDIKSRSQIFPINPNGNVLKRTLKKIALNGLSTINKVFPINYFSPSIIAIGHKNNAQA